MLINERYNCIVAILNEKSSISVKELSNMLSVTGETIRRDLEALEKMNVGIKRIHGGAYKIKDFDNEVPVQLREQIMVKEKQLMGAACADMVCNEESIMLDSSTTALYVAKNILSANLKVTVITNSLSIFNLLVGSDRINLINVGGMLRSSTKSFTGYIATDSLKKLHADKAFVSPPAVHMQFGITDHHEGEARVRYLMLKNSSHNYLVIDHTKLGKTSVNHITGFEMIHSIVADIPLTQEWQTHFSSYGINHITIGDTSKDPGNQEEDDNDCR